MVKQRKKMSCVTVTMSFLVVFFLMFPALLHAGDVTLAWDPNSESNLAGYKLYYDGDSDSEMYGGTGASEGDSPVVIYLEDLADAGSPTYTLTGLEDGQYYYFALTAFDTDGLESDFSEEVGTLIGSESAYSKAVADPSSGTSSEASDGSGSTSGGSGGGCFITGATNGHAGNPGTAAVAVLLLLAAAVAVRPGRRLKSVKVLFRNRKKE